MLISKKTWCSMASCNGTLGERKTVGNVYWVDRCEKCGTEKHTTIREGYVEYVRGPVKGV